MAYCRKCRTEIPPDADKCPKCGAMPGTVENIVGVVGTRSRHKNKERKDSRAKVWKKRRAGRKKECKKCGREIDEFMDTCPFCGTVGGSETITDLIDE